MHLDLDLLASLNIYSIKKEEFKLKSGDDGIRTRDLLRDRQAF